MIPLFLTDSFGDVCLSADKLFQVYFKFILTELYRVCFIISLIVLATSIVIIVLPMALFLVFEFKCSLYSFSFFLA